MPCGEQEYDRSRLAGIPHAQQQGQVMNAARAAASSTLYWQCVGLCLQARTLGLKVIERHRLNQFIALHRAGVRVPKPVQHAAMRIVAVRKVRQRLLQMPALATPARGPRTDRGGGAATAGVLK